MKFTFVTEYTQTAVTAMAKALRKTVRSKRNRRSRLFGIIVVIFALFLLLPTGDEKFVSDFRTLITLAAVAVLVFTLIFEDRINGYIAIKRMLPGLKSSTVTFSQDSYFSQTELGSSQFSYDNIVALAENNDYFVFIFSNSHAQVYDKKSQSGGTAEDFRSFIQTVTEKEIISF